MAQLPSKRTSVAGVGLSSEPYRSEELQLLRGSAPSDTPIAATAEEVQRLGAIIWCKETCETKSANAFSAMMKSAAQKQKRLYVVPGKVTWIKGEFATGQLYTIEINSQLRASLSKNKMEVTLEYCESDANNLNKNIKTVFVFVNNEAAERFYNTVQKEKIRAYITCENFTSQFQDQLNTAVRAKIEQNGDLKLNELFLSYCTGTAPTAIVDSLFMYYCSLLNGEDPSAESFAALLSAVAEDPVICIIFLCCELQANPAMFEHFDISSFGLLFDELLRHIHSIVRQPEWQHKRDLFLAQFRYPTNGNVFIKHTPKDISKPN